MLVEPLARGRLAFEKVVISDVVLDHRRHPVAVGTGNHGGRFHINLNLGLGGSFVVPEVGSTWWIERRTQDWTLVYQERAGDLEVPSESSPNDFEMVIKSVDEPRTSMTVLDASAEDDELFLAIGADETWKIDWEIIVHAPGAGSTSTPGFRYDITAPTGADISGFHVPQMTTAAVNTASDAHGTGLQTFPALLPAFSTPIIYRLSYLIVNGSTAGDVKLRWAQNASSGAAVNVLAKSRYEARKWP